ncbi:hypothetical protein OXPF_30690 [Oxobacter pfennigii]|uniref:Polymer-forming cytoskeletal n=1 Tax=Oxobacter pfennigii TaxID=36849 RepID=A0A0P8WM90_9CLOT|nr:polymer-forming cytoskeletal protein [Oxobacter pfennigii]KPU43628.1 hypothetical protein OXPF_30690 [Oxobacter pfennigii]
MRYAKKLLFAAVMFILISLSFEGYVYANSAGDRQGGIVKLSGDIYVNEGSSILGDAVTLRGDIYVNGSVTGNAVTLFGDIIVNGTVMGDAVTVSGKITVGDKGRVLGNTVEAIDGSVSQRLPGSYRYDFNMPGRNRTFWGRFTGSLLSFSGYLVLFLFSALVYLIMPKKIHEMAQSIEQDMGRKAGLGVLTLIGSPLIMIILSILLAITILGIVVIPFAWIAYAIAMLVGMVPVYLYLGRKISLAVTSRQYESYGAIAAGLLILWLIKVASSFGGVYTGWINVIINMALYVIGIGTLFDYIITHRKRKPPKYIPPDGQGAGPAPVE